MRKRTKQRVIVIAIIALIVVLANVTAVTLALFTREYNRYNAQLLTFGSVNAGIQIKNSGADDSAYSSYINLNSSDLMAGNKLYYDTKLSLDEPVFVRLKATLQVKTKGTQEYVEKTYLNASTNKQTSYISIDVLNTSGSSGSSVVNGINYARNGDFVYTKRVLPGSTTTLIYVCLSISELFGTNIMGGDILNNSSCRIVLEVESVQEEQGLTIWGYETV